MKLSNKVKFLKTVYGTPILPLSTPDKGLIWATAHPDEDKSRQFTVPVRITGIEGGMAAVNEFFGVLEKNETTNSQLEPATAEGGTDSP